MQRTPFRAALAAFATALVLAACGGGGGGGSTLPRTNPTNAPTATPTPQPLPSPAAQSNSKAVSPSTTAATTATLPATGGITTTITVPQLTAGSGNVTVTVATGGDATMSRARAALIRRRQAMPGGAYLLQMDFVPDSDMTLAAVPGFSLDVTQYVTGAGLSISQAGAYLQGQTLYAGIVDNDGNFNVVGPLTIASTSTALTVSYTGPAVALTLKANQHYTVGVHLGPISAATATPSPSATATPTAAPTATPTPVPTSTPTATPTPTPAPTATPTASPTPAAAIVNTYAVSGTNGSFDSIVKGPDGNMWFTVSLQDKVGKITPQGVATTYGLPGNTDHPESITAGADGKLWFTEGYAPTPGAIGEVTTSGAITIFGAPTFDNCLSYPSYTAAGPDGHIWFADSGCSDAGYIDTANPTTGWTFFANIAGSTALVNGPDGNVWVANTGDYSACIGRVTPTGTYTAFSCPSGNQIPLHIVATPDGNIWYGGGSGIFERFNISSKSFTTCSVPFSTIDGMAAGDDGNLWITGRNGAGAVLLAYGDSNCNMTQVPLTGTLPGVALDLAPGPNNTLWFFTGADSIGKIDLGMY